jgi:hypothetical protein
MRWLIARLFLEAVARKPERPDAKADQNNLPRSRRATASNPAPKSMMLPGSGVVPVPEVVVVSMLLRVKASEGIDPSVLS